MEENYLIIVDKVVMNAFNKGAIAIRNEEWEDYAIRHRLLLYGEIRDNYYSLNELGIRYVMEGCSKGMKEKVQRQENIERLEIETQSFTKRKQKWIFRFAVSSFILSILSILAQVGLLSKTLQLISDLVQWICCIL
jgi:hypothetical protein